LRRSNFVDLRQVERDQNQRKIADVYAAIVAAAFKDFDRVPQWDKRDPEVQDAFRADKTV